MMRRRGQRLLGGYMLAVYAFLYVPILVLVVFSFNDSRLNVSWHAFTLTWYGSLLLNENILRAATNSLIVATTTATLSAILGSLAAFALVRHRFPGRRLLDVMLYVPIVLPSVIMGVSLLITFVALGLRPGLGTIILAHTTFGMAIATVVIRARLLAFDRRLEMAAMDLGANRWQTFRHVTLPLVLPGVVAGMLLTFTLSLDDVVIALFTSGPGSTTLPLYIFSSIRLGVSPEINALCTLMLLVTAIVMVVVEWLRRRGTETADEPASSGSRRTFAQINNAGGERR